MMSLYHQKPNVYPRSLSLFVSHLQTSLSFYQSILGFQVLKQKDHKAILTADGENPLLFLEELKDPPRPFQRTTGLYHFALLVPRRKDLAHVVKHLLEHKIRFGASDHSVSEAIYLDDPDGNGIEVYCDRPTVHWDWLEDRVMMTTEALDLEDLLQESVSSYQGIPEKTILGHMHLKVSDLEETEAFYTKGMGFKRMAEYPGASFMATGDYHHHLACNIWHSEGAVAPKEKSIGLHWFSILFPTKQKRLQAIERLKSLDVKVERIKEDYYTKDPSGNKIRLII